MGQLGVCTASTTTALLCLTGGGGLLGIQAGIGRFQAGHLGMLLARPCQRGVLCGSRSALIIARRNRSLAISSGIQGGMAAETVVYERNPPEAVPQADAAWEWFNSIGAPKFWVSMESVLLPAVIGLPSAAVAAAGGPYTATRTGLCMHAPPQFS